MDITTREVKKKQKQKKVAMKIRIQAIKNKKQRTSEVAKGWKTERERK